MHLFRLFFAISFSIVLTLLFPCDPVSGQVAQRAQVQGQQQQWSGPIQGQSQQTNQWQTIPGQTVWGPWQAVPGQTGQWGPWQPVDGNVNPGNPFGPTFGGQTINKTIQKQVQVFNPQTGTYEWRTVTEIVPTQIGPVTPGGNGGQNNGFRFMATIINRLSNEVTVTVGNQTSQIFPGNSWQVNVFHGQQYSYSGPPRQTAPGQMVGGGVARGTFSSNQPTITLGQPQQNGNLPNNSFVITIVNNRTDEITFNIGSQSRKIPAGQSSQFNAVKGQQYGYSGSPRQTGPGTWVGGGTAQGIVSSNQRTIFIGGSAQDPANPSTASQFEVTFVNKANSSVVIRVMDQNQNSVASMTMEAGQRFSLTAKDGYSYIQEGPVVYRNGGAISGTRRGNITSSQPVINVGG